ncbi:2Fe-2S ferredoxin [Mesorhizobium loti]|uniref:2Fe-2S ferredoxin n=1 Tax=Rhizobium loti TaxID=381 RepID=A0A101KP87_RHILI|nr:2Fe-2S ferredoxin [Mesorhizobium loti]
MTQIIMITVGGARFEIEAENGSSLMEVAVRNAVPGIVAECGGVCACATCHVYVDDSFAARIEPPKEMEAGMLEFAYDLQANSRLSCQIRISDNLEGLIVRVPQRQG